MKLLSCLIAGFLLTNVVACDKEEENSKTANDATALTTVKDSAVANVGALAIGSISPASFGFTSDQALGLAASDRDANCTDNGSPVKDNVELNPGDEEYAARAIYCSSVFNAVSPDSAMGAMTLASMVVCEIDKQELWLEENFSSEGKDMGSITITPSSDCMEQFQVDALTAESPNFPIDDVVFTALGAEHAFDKKITFTPSWASDTTEMYFIRNSGDYVAFKTASGWSFSLNKATGELKYESIGSNRRIRVKVNGTLNEDGQYSEVTELSGFNIEFNEDQDAWSTCATANGNPATGIATAAYSKLEDGTFTAYEDGCSSDSCESDDRLTAAESVLDSLLSEKDADKAAFDAKEELVDFSEIVLEGTVVFSKKR